MSVNTTAHKSDTIYLSDLVRASWRHPRVHRYGRFLVLHSILYLSALHILIPALSRIFLRTTTASTHRTGENHELRAHEKDPTESDLT